MEPTAAKPSNRKWLWIGLAAGGGCLLLIVVAVSGIFALIRLASSEEEMTERERALLMNIDELAEWTDYSPDLLAETFYKEKWFDGSYELNYEYDAGVEGLGLYLAYSLTVERTASDARTSYSAYRGGLAIGKVFGGNVSFDERNDLFSWGDVSIFGILNVEGQPAGNYLVAQKDTLVVYCLFSGVYFDDAVSIGELFGPVLARALELEGDSARRLAEPTPISSFTVRKSITPSEIAGVARIEASSSLFASTL